MSAPVSVQLYTVREALSQDAPGTLRRLADLGFQNVELFGFTDRADEFATLLADAGLVAPSAHGNFLSPENDAERAFAAAKTVGATTLIDPMTQPSDWKDADVVERTAERLNSLLDLAGSYGLRLGYHNHEWEFEERVGETTALEHFASLLDPAAVLEIDTFWVAVGGQSPVRVLQDLGERVTHLHVKDGPISRDTTTQTAVGDGAIDVRAILAAAPDALRVIELDDHTGDVFTALERSLAFLAENDR